MILLVERFKEFKSVTDLKGRSEPSTIGRVTLKDDDGKELWKGFSCENGGPDTDTPMQDKRIVAREYNLEWTTTTKNANSGLGKWQNNAIWITCDETLKTFRGRRILIHCGNYPSDTEGCILLGKDENGRGAVSKSVVAIIELFDILKKVGIGNVKLVVKNSF